MDTRSLSLPVFFIILCFVFIALQLLKTLKLKGSSSSSSSKLPPGPWKLPFIGNLHQLASSLPHQALRNLANKYGPLMQLKLGEVPAVIVSSPEIAKDVMKTHDVIFASRPQIIVSKILFFDSTDIAFSPYGNYWRQLRKLCNLELLSAKRVQSFRSLREAEVSNLVKSISLNAGTLINLTNQLTSLAYTITSKAAFGEKIRDLEQLKETMKEVVRLGSGFNVADLFPSIKLLHIVSGIEGTLLKYFGKTDRILQEILDEHKSKDVAAKSGNDQDLVDVLLKYHEDGADPDFSMRDRNIKAVLLDIITAGSETSSNVIIWAMAEMMRNTRIMEKAQSEVRKVFGRNGNVDEDNLQELHYLKLVIKETLRLHPPVPLLLPRICGEECEIKGYKVPVNTRVIINAWAINRDPNYWTDPEVFNPERFVDSKTNFGGSDFEFIPFGAGRRICPGIFFGIANVELQLGNLLFHFDWKLPDGLKPEELDMTETFGSAVGRKKDLYLIPVPCKKIV